MSVVSNALRCIDIDFVVSDLVALAYALRCIGLFDDAYFNLGCYDSLVLATKTCQGPSVPMRVGRIDAVAGGASGVPEPQQDLATHTAQFERMGFTATEMIS